MTVADPDAIVTSRAYDDADHEAVVALFARINRELAPEGVRKGIVRGKPLRQASPPHRYWPETRLSSGYGES